MNDKMVNQRLGDYQILSVLGAGGMGRVYKVRNVLTDRVEAMKVLLPDLQGQEDLVARFLREIKVLAALEHQNIAQLRTALTIDNQLVMIMEYVEGETISTKLNHGALPVMDALRYLDQVLDALSYAHARHVIHRDIKPANMMVTRDETVKLMDFGIARSGGEAATKLTATGSTLGSLSYMSPEQVKGEATDERSDLYSLGISLYEMVTGKKPFDAGSNFSIMAAHINETPKPPVELTPGLPNTVNELILTAIAKAPDARFQSADAFRRQIQTALLTMPNEATVLQGSRNNSISSTPVPAYVAASPATAPLAAAAAKKQATPVPAANSAATMAMGSTTSAHPSNIPQGAVPAAVVAQQQPSSSNRGLYMALGALVVVAVLAAAGIYLPLKKKVAADAQRVQETLASSSQTASQPVSGQPTSAPTATQPIPTQPLAQPPAPVATSTTPAETPVAKEPAAKPKTKKLIAESAPPAQPANNAAQQAAAAAAAQAQADLDAAEKEVDQLTVRAASVNSSLETLQRQQAAAGYGLRGDMSAKQASMNLNISKAQNAIQHNDAARAQRYAQAATADVEALERFLGR